MLVGCLVANPLICRAETSGSVAFYYGDHPPISVLHQFRWVVVQPTAHINPRTYDRRGGSRLFAYVSVGEAAAGTRTLRLLPHQCRDGMNSVWNSVLVNQSLAACRQFYLERIIQPLWKAGYRGFFLDTIDSYRLITSSQQGRAAQRQGLVALIRSIKKRWPTARLLLNRGFSIIPRIKRDVFAVAAESLYDGWDQLSHKYVPVRPSVRKALESKLRRVREMGIPVIAIDYLPSSERAKAQHDAQRIESKGYIPYVTNRNLDIIGISSIDPLPRKVLLIYSGKTDLMHTNLNWYAQAPLNYLGYATRIVNADREKLPDRPLTGQYAGIVTWFDSNHVPKSKEIWRFLRLQIAAGVPVAILGNLGTKATSSHLEPLGISTGQSPAGFHPARLSYVNRSYIGFESTALPSPSEFSPLRTKAGQALAIVKEGKSTGVEASIMPWGGYVLAPFVVRQLPQGSLQKNHLQAQWILNPFRFFRSVLGLTPRPVPVTTTANGKRLLFAQIDGDGFPSKSWIYHYKDQRAGEVILKAILEKYPQIPVAASVIASEFTDSGLYSDHVVSQLQRIARRVFRLPWVEIGTHMYSHPFNWPALERDPNLSSGLHLKSIHPKTNPAQSQRLKYEYNLPVPGYRFSPAMEVTGSIGIINRLLAPPGKKVAIAQWSGDTDPDAQVVGLAYKDGVMNINGGNSTITKNHPSLTNISALGIWKGRYFQVYAPDTNEDVLTDGWKPPYCGFEHIIQTFNMTNAPRRLEPIDIYYHFYSGARPCALKQLKAVYRWAIRQKVTPMFPSQYAHIALGFEHMLIARSAAGFQISHYGADKELRIPTSMGFPSLLKSHHVTGYRTVGTIRYVNLAPGTVAQLDLQPKQPPQPYLISANGITESFRRRKHGFTIALHGHVPISITVGNAENCRVYTHGKIGVPISTPRADVHTYQFKSHEIKLRVECH